MRYSESFIPTLKEIPVESEISSHALTLRAGLIRKIASGIYAYLPMGYRVLRKIEKIIREEMTDAGAIELHLPVVQPSDLWIKSGRWDEYGPEMFRLKDRNERLFCLGPTHEELITFIAYLDIKSYRDLPINLFQIQVKFRDEIRPRYGLLRAREFVMKDAYSFSENEEDLDLIYKKMYKAYSNIIEKIGLDYEIIEADTGLIGGKFSHEFLVLANDGEEKLVFCPKCGYVSNLEKARYILNKSKNNESETVKGELEEKITVHTPGASGIKILTELLEIENRKILKTMLLEDKDNKKYAVLLRGDKELNISKVEKFLGKELELFENKENSDEFPIGFLGPVNFKKDINLIADQSLKSMFNFVAGANKTDYHILNVNYDRDFKVDFWGDFSYPCEDDFCFDCGSGLKFEKGIEVGHIFKLGSKYSEKIGARFLDKNGVLKPFIMGCYGIGVSRILAAAIEQSHDEKGIIWPKAISPFLVNLILTTLNNEKLVEAAEKIYLNLSNENIEVLYDDRNVSTGIKFKDADLIGIPLRIIVGNNFLKCNAVEVEYRKDGRKFQIEPEKLVELINDFKKI